MKPSLAAIIVGLAVLGLVESRPEMKCVPEGHLCTHEPPQEPRCCPGSRCVGWVSGVSNHQTLVANCGPVCGRCEKNWWTETTESTDENENSWKKDLNRPN